MRFVYCLFFKKKTAYEMRISDWSSDVCSSDLIIHVMEGRRVLRQLTVEQNLIIGGHKETSLRAVRQRLDEIYSRIGRLAALKDRTSGYLSGGEQQMLVIGRAMMARPKLMLIAETSLGLAPLMVDEGFAVLKSLKDAGVTLLVVEQNARVALQLEIGRAHV